METISAVPLRFRMAESSQHASLLLKSLCFPGRRDASLLLRTAKNLERTLETCVTQSVIGCRYGAGGPHLVLASQERALQPPLCDATGDRGHARYVVLRYEHVRGKGVSAAVHVVNSLDLGNGANSNDIKNLPRKRPYADVAADDANHVRKGSDPFGEGDMESVALDATLISQSQWRRPYGKQSCHRRDQHERQD